MAALYEWQRKSELSADRAGLLATQDPAVAFRVHMKLASGSGDLSRASTRRRSSRRAQEYLDAADLRDSVLKLLLIERPTHPFAVVRAAELRALGRLRRVHRRSSPAPTRAATTTPTPRCREAAKQAADSYTEAFGAPRTPSASCVHDVAGFFGSAKLWLDEQLRRTRD